jgi:hypothetical protein
MVIAASMQHANWNLAKIFDGGCAQVKREGVHKPSDEDVRLDQATDSARGAH